MSFESLFFFGDTILGAKCNNCLRRISKPISIQFDLELAFLNQYWYLFIRNVAHHFQINMYIVEISILSKCDFHSRIKLGTCPKIHLF